MVYIILCISMYVQVQVQQITRESGRLEFRIYENDTKQTVHQRR